MNPYEVLGVEKDAIDDEIKAAYRTLAKRWHSDRNPGDEEAKEHYSRIDRAYQILSDLEKRKKYDETGETAEARNRETEELVQILMPILLREIQECGRKGTNLRDIDLIVRIKQKVDEQKGDFDNHKAALQRGIDHMKQAVCRFSVEGEQENVLESIVRKEISNNERAIEGIETEVARLVRVLDYLKTCKYDWTDPWNLFSKKTKTTSSLLMHQALGLMPKTEE